MKILRSFFVIRLHIMTKGDPRKMTKLFEFDIINEYIDIWVGNENE